MSDKAVLKTIADTYGTPCYVYDLDVLKAHVQNIRNLTQGSYRICYSIKANPFLTRCMSSLVDALEVCSPGELEICIASKIDPDQILLSGVVKTEDMIERAIGYGVTHYTAESIRHMTMLEACASRHKCSLEVLLRKTAGSQFGMCEEDVLHLIKTRNDYPHLNIQGIHYFAGTMQKKSERKRKELESLRQLYDRIENEYGVVLSKLEYGGGMPVALFQDEDFSDPLKPLAALSDLLADFKDGVEVTTEAGRFFAASCGTYLTRIMDRKMINNGTLVLTDGGMHQMQYDGQMMGMKKPVIDVLNDTQETENICICGALCTTSDVMVRSIDLPRVAEGDVLAFHNTGAYSMCEGPALLLSRELPAVVLKEGTTCRLVRHMTQTYRFHITEEEE